MKQQGKRKVLVPIFVKPEGPPTLERIAELWPQSRKDDRGQAGYWYHYGNFEGAISASIVESTIDDIKWLLEHDSAGRRRCRLGLRDAMLLRQIVRCCGGGTSLISAIMDTLMGKTDPSRQTEIQGPVFEPVQTPPSKSQRVGAGVRRKTKRAS
jgi:hypothetical protein